MTSSPEGTGWGQACNSAILYLSSISTLKTNLLISFTSCCNSNESLILVLPDSNLLLTTEVSSPISLVIALLLAPVSCATTIIASLARTLAFVFLRLQISSGVNRVACATAAISTSISGADRFVTGSLATRRVSPTRFFVFSTNSSDPSILPSSAW